MGIIAAIMITMIIEEITINISHTEIIGMEIEDMFLVVIIQEIIRTIQMLGREVKTM